MTAKERVKQELKELEEKKVKLARFIETEIYMRMTEEEKDLLVLQFIAMGDYAKILKRRLEIWREL